MEVKRDMFRLIPFIEEHNKAFSKVEMQND